MSKITTIVDNIITKVNEHTNDVTALEALTSSHINLSGITAYHLLQGNLSATINANYVEVSSTTTRNYTTSDYIFDSLNNKLYDCVLASSSGVLLTNTTYFTLITAGTLQINNGIIPLAHGIDSNGSKNSIVVKNETITGVTYTDGKNYLYKTDTGYGVKAYEPRYLDSELVRRFAGEQPDYYDVESNKWFNCDAGTELVTNGTFSSGVTTGWTADGSNILSVSNGTMLVNRNNSTLNGAKQTILTEIGKKYTIRFKVTSLANSGTPILYVGSTINGSELGLFNNSTTGTFEYSFVAQTTNTYLQLGVTTSGTGIVGYDDITCFETDIVPTTEITESRNYMNHIVHADADGGVLYVEELPKIEYKNVIKAEEYLGKNAITAKAIFDRTTYKLSGVYKIATAINITANTTDFIFEEEMDNIEYEVFIDCSFSAFTSNAMTPYSLNKTIRGFRVHHFNTAGGGSNPSTVSVIISGGRN